MSDERSQSSQSQPTKPLSEFEQLREALKSHNRAMKKEMEAIQQDMRENKWQQAREKMDALSEREYDFHIKVEAYTKQHDIHNKRFWTRFLVHSLQTSNALIVLNRLLNREANNTSLSSDHRELIRAKAVTCHHCVDHLDQQRARLTQNTVNKSLERSAQSNRFIEALKNGKEFLVEAHRILIGENKPTATPTRVGLFSSRASSQEPMQAISKPKPIR